MTFQSHSSLTTLNYPSTSALHNTPNMFDKTPQSSFCYGNSMIRACAQAHIFEDALLIKIKIVNGEIKPDSLLLRR
ncbi:hypothetical protein POPTR_015G082283v4 [Populus trichocarpa]|uniref:Uncharacterized protein n=1 Tax=Populus trichocarpa TaxID=3694 RepID=A0ACC0RWV9_POPTR|nr:hypothetical protein POPTR_015G082283v4 [Populus trichocarpa]